jgi:hypothetical protein
MRDGRTQPGVKSRVEKLKISLTADSRLTPMIWGKNDLGVMLAHLQITRVTWRLIVAHSELPVDKVEMGRGVPLGRFRGARGDFELNLLVRFAHLSAIRRLWAASYIQSYTGDEVRHGVQ